MVSQTSDWAHQEEDNNTTITIEEQGQSDEESTLENQDTSDWGPEGEDAVIEASETQGESGEAGVFEEREEEEEFVEPPEEAKLFVGNLPYDVDSQKLAMLFEKAGIVEIAEVNFLILLDYSGFC